MKIEMYACDKCGKALISDDLDKMMTVHIVQQIGAPYDKDAPFTTAHLCRPCAERLRKSLPFLGGRQ